MVVVTFGVGGNGEFACRFSGFGEPKLPTELVQLDDDACRECATCTAFSISTVASLILFRGVAEFIELDGLAAIVGKCCVGKCIGGGLLAGVLGCNGTVLISTDTINCSCG